MTQAERGFMRVAHIIKVTRISGAESHLLVLLAGLRQRGIDARLIILVERNKPMDDMADEAEERDIPVTRLIIRRDFDLSLLFRLSSAPARHAARYSAYAPDSRRPLWLSGGQDGGRAARHQQPT